MLVQPELIEKETTWELEDKMRKKKKLLRVVQHQSGFRGRNPIRREECNTREIYKYDYLI